ncbi:hypothetical protein Agub_g3859, partial [Astrephomene gubernaculifera]
IIIIIINIIIIPDDAGTIAHAKYPKYLNNGSVSVGATLRSMVELIARPCLHPMGAQPFLFVFLLCYYASLYTSAWGNLGPLFDDKPHVRTRLRPELNWDWGHHYTRVSVDNQRVSSVLSHVLNYNFTLPRIQLERGLTYLGSACRLRRVVRDLLMGRDVKIGVVGGSVSWGQSATRRGVTDWFSTLSSYMVNAFPTANITARNGCTPGVPSSYMIMCLELSVDPDVDLVFLEYTLNDGHDDKLYDNSIVRNIERLIRRVMALPKRPAVVILHHMSHYQAHYPEGHPKSTGSFRPFYETSEDAQGALAHYYDVQSLSQRTAFYRLAQHKEVPGFAWEEIFADFHPGDHGHKMMADLAVHLVQQVAVGLVMHAYGPADEEVVGEPLPRPMYKGNLPPDTSMCIMNERFKLTVVESRGWEYVNEGTPEKPKPGYVASLPGSVLRVQIDTDRSALGSTAAAEEPVHVFFHHLRSYEKMGQARFSCVSGCSCNATHVDALIRERVSQLYLAGMQVTQAKACVIEITVLDQTSDPQGRHKFKVAGVVVSERPGKPTGITPLGGHNQAFGLQQHTGDAEQVVISKAGRKGVTERRRLQQHPQGQTQKRRQRRRLRRT